MLNDELELVKSLTATLASFKEDPSVAIGRYKSGGGASEQPRDPDVWPPPTPQEPRCAGTLTTHNQQTVLHTRWANSSN